MKTRTILLTLLMSAAALAFAPGAQAAPNTCPPVHTDSYILGVYVQPSSTTCHIGVAIVDANRVCGAVSGVSAEQVREDVTVEGATGSPRTVHLAVGYCAPELVCACDPILAPASASAALQPPIYCVMAPCGPGPVVPSACGLKAATPDQVPMLGAMVNPRTMLWGSDAGCDVDAATPSMDCAPPSSTGIDQTVYFVHVHGGVCDGGIPDRVGPIVASLVQT